MTYRLRITSKNKIYHEVFKEDLGSLHLFAEANGNYGQRAVIHETVEALDGYEELGLVDAYTLSPGAVDQLTGAQRPRRGHLRG
jgi:hypothetical protein